MHLLATRSQASSRHQGLIFVLLKRFIFLTSHAHLPALSLFKSSYIRCKK